MPDAFSERPSPPLGLPQNEAERLEALRRYRILDTPPEAAFDRITSLAARLFGVPIVLVSLIDESRAWFKSCYGLDLQEVKRDDTLCRFALLSNDVLIIPDALQDDRFACNPFVQGEPNLRFYAGAPLLTHDGFNLGTLCLLDTKPRSALTEEQEATLADLAAMVVDELELRQAVRKVTHIDAALLEVTQNVSGVTGDAFFKTLVQHLTQVLGMDYACVSALIGEDQKVIQTIAFCAHGQIVDNIEYALHNTPCLEVIQQQKLCCYPQEVQAQFPDDAFLAAWNIASYAAIPFFDSTGNLLGLLSVMDSKPLANVQLAEALLTLFALRIATERERQQTEVARQEVQQQLASLVEQRTAELSQTNKLLQLEIAERQQAEIALRKEQEVLKVLLDNVQAGIVACNSEGILTLFNRAAREFHGLPEQPIPPEQWAEYYDLYLPGGTTPMSTEEIPLFRALQGQTVKNVEMMIVPQAGAARTLLANGQAIDDGEGKKQGAVVVMHDITERKQIETALRESEAQLSSIFETIPDGIVILDQRGYLMTANTAAEQILRLTRSDMIERTYNDPSWSITTVDGQPFPEQELPFEQVMQTGKPVYAIEHALTHADGTRAILSINASPLTDAAGNITHVIAAISDITERKQAEVSLRESEERYRSVIETAAEGIVLQNADGTIFTCNASAERILGLTTSQMMGRTSLDPQWVAIREDGSPFPGELHPSMVTLQTGEPQSNVVMGICKPDATLTWISINTRPLFQSNDPQPFAVVASFFDITDRKQAEAERAQLIQEQAARLKAEADQQRSAFLVEISTVLASSLNCNHILKNVANLVVPFFADWCAIDLLHPNQTIERIAVAHRDPKKVELAWQLHQRYPKSLDATEGVPKVLRTRQTEVTVEISDRILEAVAQDAEHLHLLQNLGLKSFILSPLIARGQSLGVISFVMAESDRHYTATDLALAENIAHQIAIAIDNARLYQAEQTARSEAESANRIKDEFLAVLSHELRSPLNPILGWSKLLQNRKLDPATATLGLQTIERNAKLQTQLIEDLLDVSRILRGKLSLEVAPVDLKPVIEAAMETVRLAAEAKGIQIQTHFALSVGLISGDVSRLQQVVWNLLSNAVKFTPNGGRVEIRLEQVPIAGEAEEAGKAGKAGEDLSGSSSYAQITVIDTGKGITPDFLPYIFDRFRQADSKTTRNFGGLGLGLAIVRQLVELHGGTVQAESLGEGQGATFTVRLPLLRQKVQKLESQGDHAFVSSRPDPLTGLQILVVDDEMDARDLLVFVLEQAGAIVTSVASAGEALQALAELEIDVLVSDIGMPEMDGYMLIQQIQTQLAQQGKLAPPLYTIALTAYAGETNQKRALAAGFQRHLSKPIEPTELVAAIASLVGR